MRVPPLRFSHHARERCKEFGINPSDLVMQAQHASVIYPHKGDMVAKVGPWTLVYAVKGHIAEVKTVLRNTQDRWEHK